MQKSKCLSTGIEMQKRVNKRTLSYGGYKKFPYLHSSRFKGVGNCINDGRRGIER